MNYGDGPKKWVPASTDYSILLNDEDKTSITYSFEAGILEVGTYIIKIANRLEGDVGQQYLIDIDSDGIPDSYQSTFNVEGSQ